MKTILFLVFLLVVLAPTAWGSVVIHDGQPGIVANHFTACLDDSGRCWDFDLTAGWTHVSQYDLPMPVAQVKFWSATWLVTMDNHGWGYSSQGWIDLGQWPASAVPEPTIDAARTAVTPNPSPGPCTISFSLAEPGPISVTIFDATGRQVRALLASDLPAGNYSPSWDGTDDTGAEVTAGVYFAEIHLNELRTASRVVLVK